MNKLILISELRIDQRAPRELPKIENSFSELI